MTQSLKLFNFNNSYARLSDKFYRKVEPIKVSKPVLFAFNHSLASELDMTGNFSNDQLAQFFSGNLLLEGVQPIAMAYAGHQFGYFVPELGDGRVLLLGEVIDKKNRLQDLQLKGSGLTPFSRKGDGRAALGPVIREYIVSEAMYAMHISTTRSLAAVTTGEVVQRETFLPGAILTRVARSHVRIGTFEYFNARHDEKSIVQLADYVIDRLYPELKESAHPYKALLAAVINAQAKLIASWMHIGFIHGVMNTDNMSISGETIDYGPCAFLDNYDPMAVFSFIDSQGRYAFSNQPMIGLWNLTQFANTLLELLDADRLKARAIAEEIVDTFIPLFQTYWLEGMRKKLGLSIQKESDLSLINSLFELMDINQADFTLTFRYLGDVLVGKNIEALNALFPAKEKFLNWLENWKKRLEEQPESLSDISQSMQKTNPLFIPRNHRIQQVILAAESGDLAPMQRLQQILSSPFDEQIENMDYAVPPLDHERIKQTFCGT